MQTAAVSLAATLLGLVCLARGAGARDLLVGAAASLREPVEEIAALYERARPGERVRLGFGASSALAAQVRAGAPLDALLCADERIVDALEAQGFVAARRDVAGNRLVVVAARDVGARLEAADDLLRPELRRIAIPQAGVPLGRYAREWLGGLGLLARLADRIVQTEHARATLAAVEHGHADAAVLYATDARVARSARIAFVVADGEQPRIVYTAAQLRGARRGAAAARFLALLASDAGRSALRAAGFDDPPAGAEP